MNFVPFASFAILASPDISIPFTRTFNESSSAGLPVAVVTLEEPVDPVESEELPGSGVGVGLERTIRSLYVFTEPFCALTRISKVLLPVTREYTSVTVPLLISDPLT
ncbi:hypothetical protein D3C87_904620 [compost metagenome]